MSQIILISDDSDEENKPIIEKKPTGSNDNDKSSLPCTKVGHSEKQNNREKTRKTPQELFVEFFEFCAKGLKHNEHRENILKYLQNKHKKASMEFTSSSQYRKLLQSYVNRLQKGATEIVVFINDVTTILDSHKKRMSTDSVIKTVNHSPDKRTKSHNVDSKRIKLDDTQEKDKMDGGASVTPQSEAQQKPTASPPDEARKTLQEAGQSRSPGSSVNDKSNTSNHLKKIKYLEQLLKQLSEEIKRLQQQDISLDEMEEGDSVYIQESLLKKRCIKVYKKLCLLNKSAVLTGRVREQVIRVRSSRYEEINKKVERYINHPTSPFPDFNDICILVKKANEKKNLQLSESTITSTAQNIFTEVGEKLQKRRQEDFVYEFGSSIVDKLKERKDPAESDEELRRKLINNRKLSRKNLDSVIEKYSKMQYDMTEQDLVKMNEESEDEQEEDEEEEQSPDTLMAETENDLDDDQKTETDMFNPDIEVVSNT